ncbi:MAG: LysR family transcriptional regulator [Planctomycetaceae bacterium]
MVDVKALRHLVVLCAHRHFGRAAASLGISQPALSKSIQRLEAALGTKLLERTSGDVRPNGVGEEVLRRARTVLGGVNELEREVALMLGLSKGRLDVGIGPAMAESEVVTAIARFVERHPNIHVELRVAHWTQLSEWLLDRQLDLFVADITEAQGDKRFHCTQLPGERLVWFCRGEHELAAKARVTRRDLLRFPIASPRMPRWAQDWIELASTTPQSGNANASRFAGTVECENYSVLKRIVRSSNCVSAALASTISAEIAEGQLVPLSVRSSTLQTQAGIVTLRQRSLSPLAQTLIAEIKSPARQKG